ncbi:Leucine-rich repeat, cysteine-containing subtype [Trema orientale]|uniref:Leucine-rich repeat, cysteine-containing subtype n=1 Tax=Trema orientale TaxID=63057 RepID=A0A2P5F7H9_TREOI|nr:Leucine-rich repeat, cysteine-containing subtype [Trema orientale]
MRNLRHLNNAGCEALTGMFPSRHFYRYKSADDQYQLQTLPLVVVGGNPDIRLLGLFNLRGSLKITHLKNLHTADVAGEAKLREKGGIESLGLHWGSDDNSEKTNPSQESMLIRFQMKRQANSSNPRTKRDIKSSASGISCDILLCEQVLEHLQPNQNLRRLLINGYPGKRFPHWDVPYLNVIHLISCKNSEHLPTLGNLRFLNTLSLREMHGVRHIGKEFYGQGIQSPFPSLKELILIDFPGLEEWSSPYGGEAFPGLKKLTVSSCPQLNVMPVLMSLEYLELRDCSANLIHYFQSLTCLRTLVIDKVRDLIYFSGEFPVKNSLLTSLGINSCPKLHLLPSELGNLTALRSLAIRWCEDLASLPQSLQNLNALESLEIGDCNSLLSLPDIEIGRLSNIRTLSIENCNNLSSLTMGFQYLTSLENLTIMYCPSLGLLPEGVEYLSALCSLTIISCPKFKTLPDGLQKLTTMHSLEIGSCPGLKALPEWIEKLASLRSLVLSDCQNVTVFPEGVKCLAALQHLSIQDCPQLLERCREHGGEDWPKIAHVPYKRIGLSQQSDPSAGSSSSSI